MTSRVQTEHSHYEWPWQVKLLRVLWAPFRIFFIRGTTRYLSPIRVAVLRLFGARIGKPALVMDGVKIWFPWNYEMAPFSAIGSSVEIYNFARVTIGAQTTVSQYSYLCTASHDYRDPRMPLIYFPIVISDQVWVAAGAFVGPGVVIGQGSVVAARSVVVKSVPSWVVVAGNPAQKVKDRVLNVPK